ncbi:protein of unknown function [Limnospira indica PCC 8005]|uniref:Uncharacterized protein n=1 Tax=Limnospira indica PCC 8005 TaxID=376219 RepID=A0A9P1KIW8_9CYAN|nr:protein of unknown function [Limnospira indica PCC 8005]
MKTFRWTFAHGIAFHAFFVVLIGLGLPKPFFKLACAICAPTRLYSLQSNRDPSAYPYHYSKALASGHISPPNRLTLTLFATDSLDQIIRA